MLERQLWHGSPWGKRLVGIDAAALARAGRELLEAQPLPGPELARRLHDRFPSFDGESLANAVRNLVPLVQLPPRGVWGACGAPTLTTAEHWLGAPLAPGTAPDRTVLRYLAAFGPASVADAQTWCGLTRLGEVFDRLGGQLLRFRDEEGRALFDLPDAPRPIPPPRPRLGSCPSTTTRCSGTPTGGGSSPTSTVRLSSCAGRCWSTGSWSRAGGCARARPTSTLEIETFRPIGRRPWAAVEREARRLLAFASPEGASLQLVQRAR